MMYVTVVAVYSHQGVDYECDKAQVFFSCFSADAYYADAVAWAVENGVASGIGGGLFAPDQDCARGQIVAFLYRAYQNK